MKKAIIVTFFLIIILFIGNRHITATNQLKLNDTISGIFEIIQIKSIVGYCHPNNEICTRKLTFLKGTPVYGDNKVVGFIGKSWRIIKTNTCKLYLIMIRHVNTGNVINVISFETELKCGERIEVNKKYFLTAYSITDFDNPLYHSVVYQGLNIENVYIKTVEIDCCDPRIFKSNNIDGLFYKNTQ